MANKNPMRLDAGESVFFTRALEYIKAKARDIKYKALKFAQLLPVSTETPSGAETVTWRQFSQFGIAKFISNYAKDFPRVDILGEEFSRKVKDLGASYGWNIKEIRRAKLTGFNLNARRAIAANRAIYEKHNAIAWNGDTERDIPGFINYPGITEYVVPVGAGGPKTWVSKTPDEILKDLNGLLTAVRTITNGVEEVTQLILPIPQYDLIKTTRLTDGDTNTIMKFFLTNNPGVKIDWLVELDGAGAGATDRIMGYSRDPMNLEYEAPVLIEQFRENVENMETWVPVHAETAGVVIYYPLSVVFGDGI